ncbi:phosphotransferase [Stackebrandtia nassauensis]|uniref:phosphotransferase n=1 Tax=Stackebrandtia nassauensis TaxID=283811 RepID=UPI0001A39A1D|nr:phosphotransferase [Stackebrandtia nassauensis]
MTGLASQRLPRAARLLGDVITRLIVSGRVGFNEEPAEEATRQVELGNRNLCALAANFADTGFTSFIDTVIPTREQLNLFVELLAPRPILLVVLAPGIAACQYRNTIRDPEDRFDFDGYDELDAQMRRELGGLGWWFDTSALNPETTATRILSEASKRAQLTAQA